jgi:hypothetical protein
VLWRRVIAGQGPESIAREALGRFRRSERFDLPLRRVKLLEAEPVQLFAALPELDRVVEVSLAGFELLNDPLQLRLRLLEVHLAALVGIGSHRAEPGSAAA